MGTLRDGRPADYLPPGTVGQCLLPPGNGGLCKRAATLKPTKCHRGLTHNSRAGNPKRLRPNCHSCPRGTLEPAWVLHQGEGTQRPQCAKGKGPENPGVAAPLAAAGCRGNCRRDGRARLEHLPCFVGHCAWVSGGTPCASVYGALRGLFTAGDLSLCICLCDREVPLLVSPVIPGDGMADCAHFCQAPLDVVFRIFSRTTSNPL